MRVLISADLEGVTGIDNYSQIRVKNKLDHMKACQYLTEEVNAAIDGCLKAHTTKIYVSDGHGSGSNIIRKKINQKAIVIDRDKFRMISGINRHIDALILIGYHGKSGQDNSFAAHTYSSRLISKIFINSHEVSEGDFNSIVAKFFGTKTIFISGTDAAINEIKIKNIATVVTKKSINWMKAKSYPRKGVLSEITKKVFKTLLEIENIGFPKSPVTNIEVAVEFTYSFICDMLPFTKTKTKTISFFSRDVVEAYLNCMNLIQGSKKIYNLVFN